LTLVNLSTPGRLEAPAAEGYERAIFALWLALDFDAGTTDSWQAARTYAEQVSIFLARYTPQAEGVGPYGDVRWFNGTRYVRTSDLGAAAIPGTSNHGTGYACDFQNLGNYATARWKAADPILRDNGWSNAEGKSVGEPWHWNYATSRDNHKGEPVPTIQEIAEAVWDAPYKTPSALVEVLGEQTTMKRLVAFAANNSRSAVQNAVKNRQVLPEKVAAAVAPFVGDSAATRAEVEAAVRSVLGSLDDE